MSDTSDRRKVSIVMPARNEEGNLSRAYDELSAVLGALTRYDYEVLIIDNASTDNTETLAREICGRDSRWKYVRFSRNFGAETSISVGIRLATGDAIINVFSDLQDPPERIPDFLAKWEEGYDVVYGVITDRQDNHKLRGLAARTAYRIIRYCSDIEIPADAGDFRLISRKARAAFVKLGERDRYVRGMIHWVGFKRCSLPYQRRPRKWGSSKAPFWWCFYFALNAITSFSAKPLRLFTLFGLGVLSVSLLASVYYAAGRFLSNPPAGVTTTLVLLLWNLAILSLGIGILGEYVGHTYAETKRRPLCLVDDVVNMDVDEVRTLAER
jgi:dolichol-phosphate mannosyltransferase